jgi:hypothetical protein
MSTKRNKIDIESLADLPPELEPAAQAIAEAAAAQAAAEAAYQAEQADITARAYALLQDDMAAGVEISGWADYREKAEKLKS